MAFTCTCLPDLCKGKVSTRTLANGYPQQCSGRECWDRAAPAVTPLLNHAFSAARSLLPKWLLHRYCSTATPTTEFKGTVSCYSRLVVTNDLHHHADLRNSLSFFFFFFASKVHYHLVIDTYGTRAWRNVVVPVIGGYGLYCFRVFSVLYGDLSLFPRTRGPLFGGHTDPFFFVGVGPQERNPQMG